MRTKKHDTRKQSAVTNHAWATVAARLRAEILSGRFQPGQRIYTVRSLMRRTKRSMGTVQKAVVCLAKEGLIEPRRGSGLYLKANLNRNRTGTRRVMLVVLPCFASPNDQWFTARLLMGMVNASGRVNATVALFQRSQDPTDDSGLLQLVQDSKPDGVAWIHVAPASEPTLRRLTERGIPVVTTVRRLPALPLPIVRENDHAYARLVMEQLKQKGHRSVGIIIGGPFGDEYYESKFDALRAEGKWAGIQVSRELWFDAATAEFQGTLRASLEAFLQERPEVPNVLVLFSYAIHALCQLFGGPLSERMKRLTIIQNLMAGPQTQRLPTGETLATIVPPLEQLGEQVALALDAAIEGKPWVDPDPLIPEFTAGDSLRPAHAGQVTSHP